MEQKKKQVPPNKKAGTKGNLLLRIALLLIGIYVVICVFLYALQDRFIFPPAFVQNPEVTDNSDIAALEPLEVTMSDGCTLRGYRINATKTDKNNIMFYFGANAEDISSLPHRMSGLSDWTIILVNYRGYVDSEGTPSAEQLYKDSLEIYDKVLEDATEYDNIVIVGRSIGSSVATCLAVNRENDGLILISPFDTMEHIVSCKCPILPTGIVLRQKFNSIQYAPDVTSPVYMLVGTEDLLVPNALSQELMTYFQQEVTYREIQGVGHNSIDDSEEYFVIIKSFLDEIGENNEN